MGERRMRKIIKIDEELCDGCGMCVPSCAEGAIQIIDGKARLVGDTLCDGLGACLGECPQGALSIEEREADDFDEAAATPHAAPAPKAAAAAHAGHGASGCPSARLMKLREGPRAPAQPAAGPSVSALEHWPVKLRLVPPQAPFLKGADLLLVADCVPFAMADFHDSLLSEHAVVIGCPKFDDYADSRQRLVDILRHSGVRSLTVVHMEVPCCHGYWRMAQEALEAAGKPAEKIELRRVEVAIRGEATARGAGATPRAPVHIAVRARPA